MEKKIEIDFPRDEKGMVGRECQNCGWYFKVKPGTGLPTSDCMCPYCKFMDTSDQFITADQKEYVKSIIAREVLRPELKNLSRTLKGLERSTRGGFLQIKVTTNDLTIPLKHYNELELETEVTCDCCGLEFSIYGVFADCPDCGRLNALTILNKSIEVESKKLKYLENIPPSETALIEGVLSDVLSGGVSAFDGFGKALGKKYPRVFPDHHKNLFQKLGLLSECLKTIRGRSLEDLIGPDNFKFLVKWFQVRHIYEHNMGVVDEDFIKKTKVSEFLVRKKFQLGQKEIEQVLELVKEASKLIVIELS